ncbi:MAG: amidohydrolase [Candidatus Woesearchaeota archaeon]
MMDAISLRKKINENAELSWKEFKTTKIICDFLSKHNVKFKKLPKTGVVAYSGKGKAILLRAELDALPFGKEVRHACGHDVHASALASALPSIRRKVVGVFQPSEEDYPSGARHVMDSLKGEFEFGVAVHVDPSLPLGKVGIRGGYVMGSVDLLRFNVKGKSAHTAFPDEGKDAILAAADIVRDVGRAFPSRKCSVVISVVNGGDKDNIVCDNVKMVGTARALDESLRFRIKERIGGICRKVEQKQDVKVEFEFVEGYPSLYNDPKLAQKLRKVLRTEFGRENVVLGKSCLANEDFAFFGEKMPICLIRVGCGGVGLHNKEFYAPDEAVEICRRVFVAASLPL